MRCLLLGIFVCLLFPTSALASVQEGQGWRTSDDHIHTSANLPMLGALSAPVSVPVTTLLHNRAGGKLTFVRIADEGTVMQTVPLNVTGTGENEQKVVTNINLNPAQFSHSGWRELRLTSNFVDSNGDREFTTTRTCIFVANSKSRVDYCGGPTVVGRCGAGAWYADTEYSVAFVDCRDVNKAQERNLQAGDTIRVKSQAGKLNVHIDPHFHDGDPGTVLLADGPVSTWRTVTIPAGLSPGLHKLHVRDQRSNGEAGVYTLSFNVGGVVDEPPSMVPVFEVSDVGLNQATFSWTEATDDHGVEGYLLQGEGYSEVLLPGDSPWTTEPDLNCGQSYTFTIRARDTAQQVGPSHAVTFETLACSCNEPPPDELGTPETNSPLLDGAFDTVASIFNTRSTHA